jgi:phosphatidylinositol glycan class B
MTESKALVLFSLCVFRLINALLIQTQFDPDEYWQTLEPAYCHAFGSSCAQTWEWTRQAPSAASVLEQSLHGPVRSHLAILPTYLYYEFVKILHVDTPFMISKGPVLLHAVLVAAPTDYFVWYLGGKLSSARWSLFCSLTSWFQAFTLVRTYSNSIETVLLMAGIALVTSQNKSNHTLAFVIGGMSVAIRFTSLAAWIPLGVLFGFYQSKSFKSRLVHLIFPCAFYGLLGLGLSILVDRYFYGFWTVPLLGNLYFNVVEGMGALYGSHPFHWYLTAGLPAITGLMLPIFGFSIFQRGGAHNKLWIVIIPYILLHSISAHKEFRFLLPILPLLCIVAGHTLSEQLDAVKYPRRKLLRIVVIVVFLVANSIAFLYLGVIHQRAPLDVNQAIVRRIQQVGNTDIISVHYLMGCHSTPLYSHLHVRGVQVDAWHLDCSPSCRASETQVCESESFSRDPVGFVQETYAQVCTSSEDEEDDDENVCHQPHVPNFVAIFSGDAAKVHSQLASIGLVQTDRFLHSIRGATVLGVQIGDTDLMTREIASWIELSVDEIVLYERSIH